MISVVRLTMQNRLLFEEKKIVVKIVVKMSAQKFT